MLSGSSLGAQWELSGSSSQLRVLSLQGGVEINNATTLEVSSVILEEQNIEQDGKTLI